MKNLSTVMTNVQKKKKNKKGFSLVELIVVLVIMAILVAALVPSLIGYIRQARQSTAKDEAAAIVQATQTIVSSAYADASSTYNNASGDDYSFSTFNGKVTQNVGTLNEIVKELAEVNGGSIDAIILDDGRVSEIDYTAENGEMVKYENYTYEIVDSF
ncbi:MAG: type II secretion system GspH family protein [Ruminococcus sp.]|nr:type II secretion system GspH family protein [Ruminococcus sp.]